MITYTEPQHAEAAINFFDGVCVCACSLNVCNYFAHLLPLNFLCAQAVSILATLSRWSLRRTTYLALEVGLFPEEAGRWAGEEVFPLAGVDSPPVVGHLDFVVVAWDADVEGVELEGHPVRM